MRKRRRLAQVGVALSGVAAAVAMTPATAFADNGTTSTSNGSAPFRDGQQVTLTFRPQIANPPEGGWDFPNATVKAYLCPSALPHPSPAFTIYCDDLGPLTFADQKYSGEVTMGRYIGTPAVPITWDCVTNDPCWINIVHDGPGDLTLVGTKAVSFSAGK